VAVGIVEAGQRQVITPLGKGLSPALDHNIPDEISKQWREVVAGNQFFQRLIPSVKIRRGMENRRSKRISPIRPGRRRVLA